MARGRSVASDEAFIYSSPVKDFRDGKASRTFENFKCNSCNNAFRIVALEDIQWAMCSKCGSVNIEKLKEQEEHEFEERIS